MPKLNVHPLSHTQKFLVDGISTFRGRNIKATKNCTVVSMFGRNVSSTKNSFFGCSLWQRIHSIVSWATKIANRVSSDISTKQSRNTSLLRSVCTHICTASNALRMYLIEIFPYMHWKSNFISHIFHSLSLARSFVHLACVRVLFGICRLMCVYISYISFCILYVDNSIIQSTLHALSHRHACRTTHWQQQQQQ